MPSQDGDLLFGSVVFTLVPLYVLPFILTEERFLHFQLRQDKNPNCHLSAMFLDLQRNDYDAVLERYAGLRKNGQKYPYWDAAVGLAHLGKNDPTKALQHFDELREASLSLHGQLHSRVAKDWTAEAALYSGQFQVAENQLTEAHDASTSGEEKADIQSHSLGSCCCLERTIKSN
jgi:hypothetical protein